MFPGLCSEPLLFATGKISSSKMKGKKGDGWINVQCCGEAVSVWESHGAKGKQSLGQGNSAGSIQFSCTFFQNPPCPSMSLNSFSHGHITPGFTAFRQTQPPHCSLQTVAVSSTREPSTLMEISSHGQLSQTPLLLWVRGGKERLQAAVGTTQADIEKKFLLDKRKTCCCQPQQKCCFTREVHWKHLQDLRKSAWAVTQLLAMQHML